MKKREVAYMGNKYEEKIFTRTKIKKIKPSIDQKYI